MNEIFNLKRFAKLFLYECSTYLPKLSKVLVTISCIIFAAWVTTIVFEFEFPIYFRIGLISTLFSVACMLAPFIVYGEMNNRKSGYFYAMLPASIPEKFISMSLVCLVVAPLVSYATIHIADSLLYSLSLAEIGGFAGVKLYNPFEGEEGLFVLVLSYVAYIAIPMMFNTIFRKSKIVKTILVYMGFVFSLIMLVAWMFSTFSIDKIEIFLGWASEVSFALYFQLAVTIAAFCVTYHKIKTVNY